MVLGDFNKATLSEELHRCRQKLKLAKPVVRSMRIWTSEAREELLACMETTDWEVFRAATNNLDEYTDTVTSWISYCEECTVPTRTKVSYANDKPWFTAKLNQIRREKEAARKSGDRKCYKELKYGFQRELKKAKAAYSDKLTQQFSANDSAAVWRGLKVITNYKPRAPHTLKNLALAQDLNNFYCRFEQPFCTNTSVVSPAPCSTSQQRTVLSLSDTTETNDVTETAKSITVTLDEPPPHLPPLSLDIMEQDVLTHLLVVTDEESGVPLQRCPGSSTAPGTDPSGKQPDLLADNRRRKSSTGAASAHWSIWRRSRNQRCRPGGSH
ncbi:uncharacterized protein LOC128752706 isoform X2 [Synchiropus splendidus]|uniref:uncharacterized protein LOC128752706 isoform X2 n=1 Tax=Synchiropus splendidus TaxID=270530 RepID=UPI00237D3A91|nr:uncharacterized protein LOC128752706 isoform X2 [Synchiropus splendidus]